LREREKDLGRREKINTRIKEKTKERATKKVRGNVIGYGAAFGFINA
jgi:hypothetical protein